MEKDRPSQYRNPSRKGKKAWIKNIDLDDLAEGLEQNRENLIKFGVESLDDLESQNLFVVDTKGNDELKPKTVKVLKSTEILNKRSKVPGLENAHKRKDRVSKKDLKSLMQIAGRDRLAHSSTKAKIDKYGLINTKAYDVWDGPEENFKEANKPEILKQLSTSEWTKAKKKPTTLSKAPIQVKKTETIPDAGKSYNPSLESWKSLINQEYITEQAREDARLQIEAEKAKIQKLIETMDETEEVDSDDDDDEEKKDEDDETNKDEAFSLSLNKPVINKKKTKTQRNKQKKHQERVELENSLKELKQQLKELQKIPLFKEQIESSEIKKRSTENEKVQKRQKLGSKHKIKDDLLDVKLSDELTDSLRSLKPEGNLLTETMKKMQSKGVIETRIPSRRKRRYNPKITEKWTYKDFK